MWTGTCPSSPDAGTYHQGRVRPLIHEALLQHDPEVAAGVEEAALHKRGVWFDHRQSTATTTLTGILDTLDAIDLDHTLSDIAAQLKHLGDTDHLDTRRAHALGLLAHPQRALDLFTHHTSQHPDQQDTAETSTRADSTTNTAGDEQGSSPFRRTGATVYLHITLADLATNPAVGSVEAGGGLGGEAGPREPAAPAGLADPDRAARSRRHHPPRPRHAPRRPSC